MKNLLLSRECLFQPSSKGRTVHFLLDLPVGSRKHNNVFFYFYFSFRISFSVFVLLYILSCSSLPLLLARNEVKWAEWVVWRRVWNLLEKSFSSCWRQQRKLRKVSCMFIEVMSAAFRSVCSSSPLLHTHKWESLQFLPGSCAAVHYAEAMLTPGRLLQSSGEKFRNAFS